MESWDRLHNRAITTLPQIVFPASIVGPNRKSGIMEYLLAHDPVPIGIDRQTLCVHVQIPLICTLDEHFFKALVSVFTIRSAAPFA